MTNTHLRSLRPGDAGWIIMRHGEYYAENDGFDATFEPLVARILADFLGDHDPVRERGWIAEGANGQRLGCIFCVALDATTAKLRIFFVEPGARGTGLGQRLLDACIDHARAAGFERLTLWTHESHRAACRLYEKNGFALMKSVPVTSFGQELMEQTWTLRLA